MLFDIEGVETISMSGRVGFVLYFLLDSCIGDYFGRGMVWELKDWRTDGHDGYGVEDFGIQQSTLDTFRWCWWCNGHLSLLDTWKMIVAIVLHSSDRFRLRGRIEIAFAWQIWAGSRLSALKSLCSAFWSYLWVWSVDWEDWFIGRGGWDLGNERERLSLESTHWHCSRASRRKSLWSGRT